MFVQSCVKLCRKTFDTKVLKNMLFGLPQAHNRLPCPLIAIKQTFAMLVQSFEKFRRETFNTKVLKSMVFEFCQA